MTGPIDQVPPTEPRPDGKAPGDMTVGELVFEVSDRASLLVREEIELAKTEVGEKVAGLGRASFAGVSALILFIVGLGMIFQTLAFGLNELFFEAQPWVGFLISTLLVLAITAGLGWLTLKLFSRSSPPTPDKAIGEAREIKESLASDG